MQVFSLQPKKMALVDAITDFQTMILVTAVVTLSLSLLLIKLYLQIHRKGGSKLPPLPEVPGLPVIGNLLQMKEKKPHNTFTLWAKMYGPIYAIKTGSRRIVVVNNTELAKEAMVTRFSSISTRKLTKALSILSADKCMVATSDYDEFYKTARRHIVTNLLGPNAQKRQRGNRDTLVENISNRLRANVKVNPLEAINFKGIFELEIFGLALRLAIGKEVDTIYVEELETNFSREELLKTLVYDPMEGVISVDWRDLFPYLKWIPNKSFEIKLNQLAMRRQAVMKSLLKEQSKQISPGEELNCYLDYLSLEGKTLSDKQKAMLIWEVILEATDTSLITTEWAMYELSKDRKRQERLYQEIQSVCGSEKITEEKLPRLPYLLAIFHETLRNHTPIAVLPLRYVHEDTQLGGYHVSAGSEVAINIYGCNMNEKQWENPKEWNPDRFLDKKFDPNDMFKTMSFGGGKRMCAGTNQAMLVVCSIIARLVQEFEWRIQDGDEANVSNLAFTSRKLDSTLAFIKQRN